MKKNREKFDSKDIISTYSDMIYRIALGYLYTKEDAEDVVQEVLMKYIAQIRKGKSFNTDEHEKYWIIRVTMNLCCNEFYKTKRTKSLPINEIFYKELELSSDNLLNDAIIKLEGKYRDVFNLFYIHRFKISEISKILRISESNVKTRLKRARDKIKENMEKGEKSFERI